MTSTSSDRYPGVRAKIRGELAGARFVIQLDIGIDDAIVPAPGWVDYPTLLGDEPAHILAYKPATAIAEKLEAMVSLGLINSRMRDFYDIWMLARTHSFDGAELAASFQATFSHRGTALPVDPPPALTREYTKSTTTMRMWKTYRRTLIDSRIDAPATFDEVTGLIGEFVMPPARATARGEAFTSTWNPGTGWLT